jgi:hypothetical protein
MTEPVEVEGDVTVIEFFEALEHYPKARRLIYCVLGVTVLYALSLIMNIVTLLVH